MRLKITQDRLAVWTVAAILAVLSFVQIIAVREINKNQVDQKRFAVYMKCLIAPDEAYYKKIGRSAYVDFCTKRLFR